MCVHHVYTCVSPSSYLYTFGRILFSHLNSRREKDVPRLEEGILLYWGQGLQLLLLPCKYSFFFPCSIRASREMDAHLSGCATIGYERHQELPVHYEVHNDKKICMRHKVRYGLIAPEFSVLANGCRTPKTFVHLALNMSFVCP